MIGKTAPPESSKCWNWRERNNLFELKNHNRLKILLTAICVGLLLGIAFSHELWFPINRTFPRAPLVFALPENAVLIFEWAFSSILVIALALTAFACRPKIFLRVVIFSLLLLAFFDQTRMQPWAYQYLLIFAVYYWHNWENDDERAAEQTIGLAQIVIAGLYVWSGIQKLNFNFSHEVLPSLLIPLQNLFPSWQPPYNFLGIAIPLVETLAGIGLLFRWTRNLAVWLAVSMHVFVLSLLIAKNYNSIVWFWNLTLIFALVFAFWRNRISLKEAIGSEKISFRKSIVAASLCLPLLNFFGCWDSFLSGALYSGNVEIPAIRITENVYENLPPAAQSVVFRTSNGNQQILPLFEWSINDTNVPVYLEQRVFEQCLKEICRLADDKNEVELIVRKRLIMLDGNYQISRTGCAELKER